MIYLDANVIIRLLEGSSAVVEMLDRRVANELLLTSYLSLIECRCKPVRDKNTKLLEIYDGFFSSQDLRLLPINPLVIEEATQIRAEDGFKVPDSIHLASAIVAGAPVFLTADVQLARCKRIFVEIL